jgi:nicotinamidase-related amidase
MKPKRSSWLSRLTTPGKMLRTENCILVVIDVQGKLALLMHEKEILFANIQVLIKSAKILNIPILWCQQAPQALGATLPQIAELLDDNEPIDKFCFNCCDNDLFNSRLEKLNKKQVLLCGIETHVCIYQTAVHLKQTGYEVIVIADAVSSRNESNKSFALNKMQTIGIDITTTEMALFELLKTAEHTNFRQIAKLIK